MHAFKVYLNEDTLCVAGVGDSGVLSAIVNFVSRPGDSDLFLQVGGLVRPRNESCTWLSNRPLQLGDRIRIEIVDATDVDQPATRTSAAEQLRSKEDYVRDLVRELGWMFQETSQRSDS